MKILQRVQSLPTWKKVGLLIVIVAIPAGLVVSALLVRYWNPAVKNP